METLKTKKLTWYHAQHPTPHDIEWVSNNFNFHDLVVQELTRPTARPKAEAYDHYIYMVLHFPIFEEKEKVTHQREIDFLLTKNELLTFTYESIPPLENFLKTCLNGKDCEELYGSKTPAHLLFYILKELFDFSLRQLDHVQENITRIEDKIFSGLERDVVEDISIAQRDIINFRRALKPQHITLESLRQHGNELFGKSLEPYFESIIGEYTKVWSLLENNKEALDALNENNTTLLNIKQNEIMKLFTILAFVTFPLSLLVSILGINTQNNPIRNTGYDFWIIVGIVFAAIIGMLFVFRKKNWL